MTDIDYFRLLVAAYAAGGHGPVDALKSAKTTIEIELDDYSIWLGWLEQQGVDNGN